MSALAGIVNDAENGELLLNWQNKPAQRFSHAYLRSICPCAFCRADRMRDREWRGDAGVRITAVQSMGYGLQLVFSDGHDRGIFPWVFFAGLDALPEPPDPADAQALTIP